MRAGLGTSLLIQGIFHNESEGSGEEEGAGDAQQSLLTLATYHLKVASSLFSTTTPHQSSTVETTGGNDDDVAAVSNRERANKAAVIDETSASNAAILHNLALCYIAQGDNTNSVPILLKAAALRRESNVDTKMYWNAPNGVLQLAEEKALLLAGKKKKSSGQPEKVKKRRMPFFR